jgi:CheY-like chemotaxis protein
MAKVLVVDDDRDTCDLLERYLQAGGHEVVCASNGWEALLSLDTHHVDLILLDVMMPGMDGPTFLKILRNAQTRSDTAVVVISALDRANVEARVGKLGVADIVPKGPTFFEELLELVARHTQGRPAPDPSN